MDKIDMYVLEQYKYKEEILEIYRLNNTFEREYWLIMTDIYSENAMKYYDVYFDILNKCGSVFNLRIINNKDLKTLLYLKPVKLWEMEG